MLREFYVETQIFSKSCLHYFSCCARILLVKGGEMMLLVPVNFILDRLSDYVSRISAFKAVIGGTMSKNEYIVG